MEARAFGVDEPFAAAGGKFDELVTQLRGEESQHMTHSELESLISKEGREIQRRLLQGHLDLRAAGETVQASVRGEEDIERTHRRRRVRGLMTVFGLVTVLRISYGARRHQSLSPLDVSLNLPEELHSHGLRRVAAVEAARGSFDGANADLDRPRLANMIAPGLCVGQFERCRGDSSSRWRRGCAESQPGGCGLAR